VLAQDYLRPAAVKTGVIDADYRGPVGWHNLRRSLATFLADNDVSLSVIQRMLRHSKPTTPQSITIAPILCRWHPRRNSWMLYEGLFRYGLGPWIGAWVEVFNRESRSWF
jgi:integrase